MYLFLIQHSHIWQVTETKQYLDYAKKVLKYYTYPYTSKQYAESLSIVTKGVNIDQLTKVLHTEIVFGRPTATGR